MKDSNYAGYTFFENNFLTELYSENGGYAGLL
jgi:hypothetical protein